MKPGDRVSVPPVSGVTRLPWGVVQFVDGDYVRVMIAANRGGRKKGDTVTFTRKQLAGVRGSYLAPR